MYNRIHKLVVAAILSMLVAACGGGGSGGGSPPPPPPPPPPPATTYTVGGTVTGLAGSGLVLQNNNSSNLGISANGAFAFADAVNAGGTYAVSVATQPASPTQSCVVTNGSGTANANIGDVDVTCTTVAAADTDMDGLEDAVEISVYGTSPVLADTDGDGYSDFREVIDLGFDPSVNNFRYNPRIADLPKIRVDIETTPIIGAIFTDTNGTTQNVSTSRSQSQTNSTSTTFGASTTVGVESTTTATAGGSLLQGPSASVSQSVSVSASATVSFDTTNTQENQTAWESMRGQGIEESTSTTGGFVRVGVAISNDGHIPFTLRSLALSSTQASNGRNPFIPLAALEYDGTSAFPASFSGGQAVSNLIFENSELDVGTVRTMLTAARSLQVEPSIFEITDITGQPFAFTEAEVQSRTAKILFDYGPYAVSELYQVATNSIPNNPGQTLDTILTDFLEVPYTEGADGIATVRSLMSSTGGRWVVTQKRNTGTGFDNTYYDPAVQPYSAANVDVRAGDEILFVLLEDADGDGIGYREELIHGTNANSADTDSDGLSDFDEIRDSWTVTAINAIDANRYPADVTSSPSDADYDKDSVNDAMEKANGLDPYNPDTDGDGITDNLDFDNGNQPLISQLPLYLGQRLGVAGAGQYDVTTSGSITAAAPQVVASATIDWETDGIADEAYNTASGGNPSTTVNASNSYAGPGSYTITVDAMDDATPTANLLMETASVVLTEPAEVVAAYGWNSGWRVDLHVRTVADLDQDGFDDVVMISNSNTTSMRGTASGFDTPVQWSVGNWMPSIYGGVETDPRRFVDLDNDGDLDIVGVDASTSIVRYGLNNGTGFDDPVDWITGINWNAARDTAYFADVDNNGYPDFVHAKANGNLTVYTTNGATLSTTENVSAVAWGSGYPDRERYPIEATDIDGDGCSDLVLFGISGILQNRSLCNGQYAGWASINNGFSYNSQWRVDLHKRWVDDVNADGLPDLVGIANAEFIVYINQSTSGNVAFGGAQTWTTFFVANQGWADEKMISATTLWTNIYPRYLADMNNDGFKDIVGYASGGVAVGFNRLGIDGTPEFSDLALLSTDFRASDPNWYEDRSCPFEIFPGINFPGICREHFPRMVGDVDGDGRADFIGFDQSRVILQSAPYVTQFQ